MDLAADRVAHLLAAVLERSPRTLTELAHIVGSPAAELEPLVGALERYDLVSWDPERSVVTPGTAALRFAHSGIGREELAELAQPSMRRLADETGETVNLIVPLPAGTEAIAQVDGSHLLGASNWVGRELGLHSTAAGKVFLAFGVVELPEGSLPRLTPATVCDHGLLRGELDAVRERGYATLVDELELGLSAVGAPVHDRDGTVVAALTVAGATLRLPEARLGVIGRVAVEQADAISERLGWRGGSG